MKLFRHPAIACKADESSAQEYVMPDGNRVLAYCKVTAEEWYSETSPQNEGKEEQPDDTLPLE